MGGWISVFQIKQLKHRKACIAVNRAWYDVIEFSNCHTEERSEAKVLSAVLKRNGIIPCSILGQSTTSYF